MKHKANTATATTADIQKYLEKKAARKAHRKEKHELALEFLRECWRSNACEGADERKSDLKSARMCVLDWIHCEITDAELAQIMAQ